MQRSQRSLDNPALNLAIELGNALNKPVLAVFGLTADFPGAQRRHYHFLLEAMPEIRDGLKKRGVEFVLQIGSPPDLILSLVKECPPAIIIGDENPIRVGQTWRETLAEKLKVPFCCVDGDVVVPTSHFPKEEYAARTLRPKIHRVWKEYLRPISNPKARTRWSRDAPIPQGEEIEPAQLLKKLKVGGVGEVPGYKGGTAEALKRLDRFVKKRLPRYANERNEASLYQTSELSAHLHFGHISPLTAALAVLASEAPQECIDSYLEELIVRRELAINFVARNPRYDRLEGCPDWALKTLAKHVEDRRPHLYTAEQLEAAETVDPIWNAAQREMVLTGRMHNYLRMYWAKKILEWTPDAETAFQIAIDLNDRYEMDGRDPNGYTGVAWAIGGKHDRPWPERPIFGTVRFMSFDGIRKKIDSKAYIRRVEKLEQAKD